MTLRPKGLKIPNDGEDPLSRKLREIRLPYQVTDEMIRGIISRKDVHSLLAAQQQGKMDSRAPCLSTTPPPDPGPITKHPNTSFEAYLTYIAMIEKEPAFETVCLDKSEIKALKIRKKGKRIDISVLDEQDISKIMFSFFEILKKELAKKGRVIELEVPLPKKKDSEMAVSGIRFYFEKKGRYSNSDYVEAKLYRNIETNQNIRVTIDGSKANAKSFFVFNQMITEQNMEKFCEEGRD